MTHRARTIALTVLFAGLLVLSGCTNALQTLSKAMVDASAANLALQTTVITAQQNGSITVDEARPIVTLNLTFAQAGKNVDSAISGISSLSPAQKSNILSIIQPVIAAATAEANTVNIANATVKTAVLASLATLQAALATAQVALAGGS